MKALQHSRASAICWCCYSWFRRRSLMSIIKIVLPCNKKHLYCALHIYYEKFCFISSESTSPTIFSCKISKHWLKRFGFHIIFKFSKVFLKNIIFKQKAKSKIFQYEYFTHNKGFFRYSCNWWQGNLKIIALCLALNEKDLSNFVGVYLADWVEKKKKFEKKYISLE